MIHYNVHFQLARTWDELMQCITHPPYEQWQDDTITNLSSEEVFQHFRDAWRCYYDEELTWAGNNYLHAHVFSGGKGYGPYKYAVVIVQIEAE